MKVIVLAKDTNMDRYMGGYICGVNHTITPIIKSKTPLTQRIRTLPSNFLYCPMEMYSSEWTETLNDTVTEITFAYKNNINDLTGIDLITNLTSICSYGAIGNLHPLKFCKNLESLIVTESQLIYNLEDLIDLPKLKTIILRGTLSNYNYAEFREIVSLFKSKPDIECQSIININTSNMYTNKKLKKESLIGLSSTKLLNTDLILIVSKYL